VARSTVYAEVKTDFLGLLVRLTVSAIVLLGLPAQSHGAGNAVTSESEKVSIQWKSLLLQAFEFDALENGFRVATQPETRATMGGPFFQGYARSLDSLHGWADGDPFLVNYVGHPMQGAVSGYIFVQNDPRFLKAEFGRNSAYWKSRLRATAFSFVYSVQFELGPLSEATVGHTQAYYPQQGFVDHVITPTIGLAWMLAEDSLDRYLISWIERKNSNPWLNMLARGTLNPSRSLANVIRGELPWHRDTRPPLFKGRQALLAGSALPSTNSIAAAESASESIPPMQSFNSQPRSGVEEVPVFQVGMHYDFLNFFGGKGTSHACHGGDGTAEYRLTSRIALVANVGGCKLLSSEPNNTRDATFYLAGTRVNLPRFHRWQPYLQVLAGGNKLSSETEYPDSKPPQAVIDSLPPYETHSLYTNTNQTNSWAMQFGGGMEYVMTSALSFKALDVEALHTWTRPLDGQDYRNALRVSTGLVLRFGTW
jgi:hypothetical protein